jgi:predicted DNA-binding transcriptional regulator AlpA
MTREILWPDRLNTKRAAAYLGVAYDTLVAWRKRDSGPAYHKLGRLVVYMKNDLDVWIERCRCVTTPTKAPSAGLTWQT